MESYAVLLKGDARAPSAQVATALGRVLDRPPGEVTRRFKESPWILLERVPAAALDEVFGVLVAAGVAAKAVPEVHMPVLSRPLRLRYADPLPRGLFLQKAAPPAPPVLLWEQLKAVSAGHAESRLLVDLVCRGDHPLRLRIDAGDFNYDHLGDRMRPSSRENLRLLLVEIRDHAPLARFSDRTLELVKGSAVSAYRFHSIPAFETYTRWLLQAVDEEELEAAI